VIHLVLDSFRQFTFCLPPPPPPLSPRWPRKRPISTTLQRRSDLCIPRNQTARPKSQFLHSYTVYVSDLYIPPISPHIFSSQIGRPIVGIYKSLTDMYECRNKSGLRPCSFLSGNIFFQFSVQHLCSEHPSTVFIPLTPPFPPRSYHPHNITPSPPPPPMFHHPLPPLSLSSYGRVCCVRGVPGGHTQPTPSPPLSFSFLILMGNPFYSLGLGIGSSPPRLVWVLAFSF
jgi:hypothetical protein